MKSLWRHPDFLKLWAGQAISQFGSLVGQFALPMVAILSLRADASAVAVLRVCQILPGLVMGLMAGVWVDRMRRRPVMIVADAGRALALLSIPAAAALGALTILHVYVAALVVSVLTVFFDVAYQSYLPALVRREHLLEANSKLEVTASVAEVSGFGLGGVLVQAFTAPVTVLVDALTYLASAASVLWIRQPEAPPGKDGDAGADGDPGMDHAIGADVADAVTAPAPVTAGGWLREIRDGLKALWGSPALRTLLVTGGMVELFFGMVGTVISIYVVRDLHFSAADAGLIYSLGGISAIAGALLAQRVIERWGMRRALSGALAVWFIAACCLPLASGPKPLATALLVLQQLLGDGALAVFFIAATTFRQTITPDHMLGRVNAAQKVGTGVAALTGALLGGLLGDWAGHRWTLAFAAAGFLITAVGFRRMSHVLPETRASA